jgi:hypothetical protein
MKNINVVTLAIITFSLFLCSAFLIGCSKNNPSNGTTLTVSFATYTALNKPNYIKSPIIDFMSKIFIKPAMAATSNISLCIKRVRFKNSSESEASDLSQDPDNDDVSGDERVGQKGFLNVTSGGSFGTVNVPNPKPVTRFRIDIDNHCSGHSAASFTTAAGSFTTNSNFTMEFRSSSDINLSDSKTITLNWQAINTALNALSAGASDSNITNALSTRGSMN